MKERKKRLVLDLDDHYESGDFAAILICAIRYSLGRRTYMPSTVTHFIMSHCKDMLSKKDLYVMIEDVERCKNYGEKCDEDTWMEFLSWLNTEYLKRQVE